MKVCDFCKKPLQVGVGMEHAGQVHCDSNCVEGAILWRIEQRHLAWKREYAKRVPPEVPHFIDVYA